MSTLRLIFYALIVFSLTGCATVINGRTQEVEVTSNPIGASVSDGVTVWTTPAKISLKRNSTHQLTFYKEGYKPQVVRLDRTLSGAVAGNILLPFGLVCWGIDAITGAQWKLLPEVVSVDLHKE